MRIVLSFAIVALVGSSVHAQSTEAGALPARFEPFLKNEHLALVRVYGAPEMPATFASTSAFSSDGKFAVYYEDLSTGDEAKPILRGRLHVWDVEKKAWPREIEIAGKSIFAIALSADGKLAAMSGQSNIEKEERARSFLGILDLASGQFRHFLLTKTAPAATILLGADGESIVAGVFDDLKRWNVKTGKESATYQSANPALVTALAPTTKANQFLAAYGTGEVRLWDADTAKPVREFAAVKDVTLPTQLAMSRDGSRIAIGDLNGPIRVLDAASGKELATFRPQKDAGERFVTSLALSHDGQGVVVNWLKPDADGDDAAASLLVGFDVETRKQRWYYPTAYRGRPAVRSEGGKLQIGGGPNHYDEYDIASGKHLVHWGTHRAPVHSIIGIAKGFIHSASADATVQAWGNGRWENRITGLPAPVTALATSRDGKSWLLACADGSLRHTPPDNGRSVAIATRHQGTITSLAYSAAGKWIYSASEDRTIKTWNTTDGSLIATFEGHSEGVNTIAVSPDDRWLASGSNDATIRLWPIKDGKLDADRDVIVLVGHTKPVVCLTFSADGKTLITGSQDRSVKIWDWAKEKCFRTIVGHKNWVTSLLLLDPTTVLTTSDDLSACIWNLKTGKEIGQVDLGVVGDCPRCVARAADGRVYFGTSNWLIYEMELRLPQSKRDSGSSK